LRPGTGDWQAVMQRTVVVRLSTPLRILVPALLVTSISARTRGVSFEGGRLGAALGAMLVAVSVVAGWGFYPFAGMAGVAVFLWLFGGAGLLMVANGARPMAFVKPICTRCRLLPVIREHEAIHLAGVDSDRQVWADMRTRHSCESLGLDSDPGICSFCPIPIRLKES